MAAIDIKHLFKIAWQRAKETEAVEDGDPVVEQVQGNVVRAIAELEIARLHRAQSASSFEPAQRLSKDSEDDPTMSAVA